MSRLPVDAILGDAVESLRQGSNLVVEAPPGAGKTTRIPAALLDAFDGEILVLEPRRLAARMAARRVAQERGERIGETVGYQVRFEDMSGPRTRLKFVTEGVLVRRMLSDSMLKGVSTVVLDEFHERHLDGDVALALLRRLQRAERRDLRLVVMSATLDSGPVVRFLGARSLRSEGRLFDLTIEHTPHSAAPLEQQTASALDRILKANRRGDVLVFLPGAAEIRRAQRACEPAARAAGYVLVTLHGDLSPEEQDRAVTPGAQRKVILSTNVAESSITIEGVTAVIDSGLARIASDSPWTGLPRLEVARISKASAKQRAGRAARTAPGHVVRLYSIDDFSRRPDHDTPEITRRELSQVVLDLTAMNAAQRESPSELKWLDPPPQEAWRAAEDLVARLGGIEAGSLTPIGQKMTRLPLHPRLGRLVLESVERGVPRSGCAAAAVLSTGERAPGASGKAALLHDLVEANWQPQTSRVFDQLRRAIPGADKSSDPDQALALAVLTALPDRVARRRTEDEALLASGGSARARGSQSEFFVAIDIEERRERGMPLVRLASPIEPEWLLELFPHRIVERKGVEWNRKAERVEQVNALLFDQLIIEEKRGAKPDPDEAAKLLAEKAREVDLGRFVDPEALALLQARNAFAVKHSKIQTITAEIVLNTLSELCSGRTSLKELESAGLLAALEGIADRANLDRVAPQTLRLAGGRQVEVHYEIGKSPWIEARLQDFFGMEESPIISGVPVVVHLLAPNHWPVQVTSDLAGFWERLYPQVRRELMRRYPKHKWPENPRSRA